MGEYRYSVGPECVFKAKLNRRIALIELGGEVALKPPIGFLEVRPDLNGLAQDGRGKIQQLKCLISRQPIDHKRGPIEDTILKLLVYGGQQMPEIQMGISKIRKSMGEFAHRKKEGGIGAEELPMEKRRNQTSCQRLKIPIGCRFAFEGSG